MTAFKHLGLVLFFGAQLASPYATHAQLFGNTDAANGFTESEGFLPIDEAFRPLGRWENGALKIEWIVADGYYLYRERFASRNRDGESVQMLFEDGGFLYDEYFQKDMEVYRDATTTGFIDAPREGSIYVRMQGCAEAGLCYTPTWMQFDLDQSIGFAEFVGEAENVPLEPRASAAQEPKVLAIDHWKKSTRRGFYALGALLGFVAIGWTLRRAVKQHASSTRLA